MRLPARFLLPALLLSGTLTACEYVRLLRPSVLKQLNPRVVRFVNYLPRVDDQNEAIIARLPGHGGLSHARPGRDGVMRVTVRVPPNEFIWQPSLVVMPRGGELEITVHNEDQHLHALLIHDHGAKRLLELPIHTAGVVRVRLDQPGLYTFACPVGNHADRGMLGLVMVQGEVPEEARLDRPRMPQP